MIRNAILCMVCLCLSGCAYLPRCESVHYKSVVVTDEGKVRDILAETASPFGNNDVGYQP